MGKHILLFGQMIVTFAICHLLRHGLPMFFYDATYFPTLPSSSRNVSKPLDLLM